MTKQHTFTATTLAASLGSIALAGGVTVVTFVGPDGGVWNAASNWSPGAVPNNGGGAEYEVRIDQNPGVDRAVFLNMNASINALTLDADDTLSFNNDQQLQIFGGPFLNDGDIFLNSTGSTTDIIVRDGDVMLDGIGRIIMSPNSTNNRIYGNQLADRLIQGPDHVIEGVGQVGVNLMQFLNEGLVHANQPNGLLFVDPNSGGAINRGTYRSSNGGRLRLEFGNFAQELDGRIEILGASELETQGAFVQGGIIENSDQGLIEIFNTSSNPTTFACDVVNPVGGLIRLVNDSQLRFTSDGTIINDGEIRVEDTTDSNDTDLRFLGGDLGDVRVDGIGRIRMSTISESARLYGSVLTDRFVNGPDHTVDGAGELGLDLMAIRNEGLIVANQPLLRMYIDVNANGLENVGVMRAETGGTMQLRFSTFTNSGSGIMEVLGDAEIELLEAVVQGGTIVNSSLGRIESVGSENDPSTLDCEVINPAGGVINVVNNGDLRFRSTGTYLNDGEIRLSSANDSTDTDLRILGGPVRIDGTGVVQMSEVSVSARIFGSTIDDVLIIGPDQTVKGAGEFGVNLLGIENEGTILADEPLLRMTIDPNGAGLYNWGDIRSVGGGIMRLNSGTFENDPLAAMTIAADSQIELLAAFVTGGSVVVEDDGILEIVSNQTNPSTVESLLDVEPGGLVRLVNDSELRFTNVSVIDNDGEILIDSTGNDTDIRINDGDVIMAGDGVLTTTARAQNRIFGTQPKDRFVNETGHTIEGAGQIGVNTLELENRGTIRAIYDTVGITFDPNALGFVNSGSMEAIGAGGMTINAGPFETSGDVFVSEVAELTRSGDFTITGGTTEIAGVLDVNSGSVLVNDGALEAAIVEGPVVNNGGTVSPGAGIGALDLDGTYQQLPGGVFQLDLFGPDAGTGYDVMHATSTVTLGGTLRLNFVSGHSGLPGQTIDVITTDATIVGSFSAIELAGQASFVKATAEYLLDRVRITIEGTGNPCPADLDGSQSVDFNDLLVVLSNWGACPAPCGPDFDGNGQVDFQDLLTILGNWGPCPG